MQDPAAVHPVARDLGRRPATTVVEPPRAEPGFWAGGPSALWHDGAVWLAYRLRRPVDAGRGYANVVARSTDGYHFETVATVTAAQFESASLERPALAVGPDETWRLYVSCSTHGSKHWWIEALSAPAPDRFGAGRGDVVLPGDANVAWKDPVVTVEADGWHLWPCRHHITDPDQADRMDSCHATSADGLRWDVTGTALAPVPGRWDGRGVRITSVLPGADGSLVAFYDGRSSAEENWEERTGAATGPGPDHFEPAGDEPLVAERSLRYLSVVALPGGRGWLAYYEAARDDGAHDLRVEYVPRPSAASQSS